MKTFKNVIWGIIFVALGVILALDVLGILSIQIFFKGWWTLFIIIPSFIGLFNDRNKGVDVFLLLLGIGLLLASRGIINYGLVMKLILPTILILVGLSFLFKNLLNKKFNDAIDKINEKNKSDLNYCATFGSQEAVVDDVFKGCSINAIFGGVTLDLRDAKVKEDQVINCSSIFGGVDIYIPENVNVLVKSNAIFGGVENKTVNKDSNKVTIYVNGTCLFGGIDIK